MQKPRFYAEAVISLLEAGADVHAQDKKGFTPLLLATNSRYLWEERGSKSGKTVIRSLLSHGSDMEIPCPKHGRRPLHIATRRDNPPAVKIFVKAGAKIDVADTKGYTPIMAAEAASLSDRPEQWNGQAILEYLMTAVAKQAKDSNSTGNIEAIS
jgi:ankyrin repeat protein